MAPHLAIAEIEQRRAEADWLGALALIGHALKERPDDPALARLQALTLADLGASHQAWRAYRDHPELFTEDERVRIEAARVARTITWSRLYVEVPRERFAAATTALEQLRALQARLPADAASRTHLAFDELIVLNRLGRHAEVAQRYDALADAGRATPGYALGLIGESLLAARRPGDAARVLEQARDHDPDDRDVTVLLAYAYAENERHDLAHALLEHVQQTQPAWPRAPGARRGHPNLHRLDADISRALIHAYGGDTPRGQAQLEALASIGPANPELQGAVGLVYMLRGWPDAALQRFRIAESLDPQSATALVGQVDALSALQRHDLAHPMRRRALDLHGTEPRIVEMDARWRSARGPGVTAAALIDDGSDRAGSPSGERRTAHRVDAHSALLHDRWRVLAQNVEQESRFDGRRVRAGATLVGVAYHRGPLDLRLLGGLSRGDEDGASISAQGGWRFDDRWRIDGWVHRNDVDASLQARAAGIAADTAELAVTWRRDDTLQARLSLDHAVYDDGNRVDGVDLTLEQRWLRHPRLDLRTLYGGHAARASREDVPYYNPTRTESVHAGLELDAIGWRRYERHFMHRFSMLAAVTREEDRDARWIPTVRYGQHWQFARVSSLRYGLGWSQPVYEGVRETRVQFDMEWRWGP